MAVCLVRSTEYGIHKIRSVCLGFLKLKLFIVICFSMKKSWLIYTAVALSGAAFFSLPYEQRQEVAKYIIVCLLLAFLIRPVGLTIGQMLRKVLGKD
jgi:hypothetical protein